MLHQAALIRWVLSAACALTVSVAAPPGLAQVQPDFLAAAREAARADRNAEAAREFEEHLAANPGDRRSLLREYADQLIYSQRPEEALPLLEEVLAWELTGEERSSAERSYALALLWSDQHRQALAAYERILADEPDNEDAHFNRIRAMQWLGRPDRARSSLAQLPPSLLQSERAVEIGNEIRRSARPLTGLRVWQMSQADGLDLNAARVEHNIFPASGAARLGASYEQRRFADDNRRIRVEVPGISGSLRASDALQLSASLALERQRGAGISRTQTVYEAAAAFLPSDRLRLDVVTARRTLDNLTSLQRGITTHHYFASADYWPDPLLKLSLRGELARYSDGNDRRWLQAQAERRVSRAPDIFIGARAAAFSFERQLDNGYFNPKRFRSAELTARGWSQIGRSTWLDLSGAAGPEQSRPGGTKLAYWLRGKLSHALSDDLEAAIVAERLSSRGATGTGFARSTVSATLGLRW